MLTTKPNITTTVPMHQKVGMEVKKKSYFLRATLAATFLFTTACLTTVFAAAVFFAAGVLGFGFARSNNLARCFICISSALICLVFCARVAWIFDNC